MVETRIARRPHDVAPAKESARPIIVVHKWQKPAPGTSDHGLAVILRMIVAVLRRAGIAAEAWVAVGIRDLLEQMERDAAASAARPPTHVVISTPSFILPEGFDELATRYPNTQFVQLSHSGLAYLSIDEFGIRNIRDVLDLAAGRHNIQVAGNNPRFVQWIEDGFGVSVPLLPNLYDTSTFVSRPSHRQAIETLRIGTFGPARPWKNQLVAAEAALALARRLGARLEYHVNGGRNDVDGRTAQSRVELFRGLTKASLVPVPWQPWAAFRRTVGSMDLLLQPSFDETFQVIVADAIAEGVPVVTTSACEWTPKSWWAEACDPASVAGVGAALLASRPAAVASGRAALANYVSAGTRSWQSWLGGSA
jgi:glycosyltransferase involved in cell wall biosynthesis